MPRTVSISVTLPAPLVAAIDGEAHRRLVRRSDVIRDALVAIWPGYVAEQLTDALRPVLDAEIVDDEPDGFAELAPHLPSGTTKPGPQPGSASESIATTSSPNRSIAAPASEPGPRHGTPV